MRIACQNIRSFRTAANGTVRLKEVTVPYRSATAMKRLRELEVKAAELEKAIAIQRAKSAYWFTEEEMRAYYDRARKLEAQMPINAPVKQITLYDDKMIITYNSPVSAGPDESRDFFLSLKRK